MVRRVGFPSTMRSKSRMAVSVCTFPLSLSTLAWGRETPWGARPARGMPIPSTVTLSRRRKVESTSSDMKMAS